MAYFLGMDIGGTKTAVALYDREFRPVGKQTMPTRPESGCRTASTPGYPTCSRPEWPVPGLWI